MVSCPYCGNDDPGKFMYPDENEPAYTICLNCNGEFESGKIEHYEAQEDDPQLSLSAITQLLDNEIKWCEGQEDSNLAVWFIKGLEQARYLIIELAKIGPLDPLPNSEDLPREKPGWLGDYGGIPHGPFDV